MCKLKILKTISKPDRVLFLDTESYPVKINISKSTKTLTNNIDIEEHILSFGYAFYDEFDNVKLDYIRKDEILFNNPSEFVNFLLTKTLKKEYVNKPLYVFAHNMSYDFRVLKTFTDKTFKKEGFRLTIAISRNVFIYKYVKDNHQIIFLSSTNYFRVSLKDLGNTFGLKKLEFSFNEDSFNEIRNKSDRALKYCYRDTEILELACKELFKFSYNEKCKFSYTLASLSFRIFRTNFYDENINMHKLPLIEMLEKSSYYGGRTDCFKIGTFKNIYKLDINSMYANSMLDNDYPVRLINSIGVEKDSLKPSKELLLNYLKSKQYLIIAEVKVKLEKNNAKLPYRDIKNKSNLLYYPDGIFTTFLSQPELEILNDDEILDVNKILIYQKDKIFDNFVTHFYEKRLKYKTEDNEVMQYFCKILLNANYGKFAQKHYEQIRNEKYDNIMNNGKMDFLDDNDKLHTLMFIDGICFELFNEKYSENTFISISSFVTSYSRVLLYKLIQLVKNELIYVDTDSLFVSKKGYDILNKFGYVDNKLLGKLKLEGILSELNTRTLKDYTTHEFITYDYFNFRNNFLDNHIISGIIYQKFKTEYKIKGIKKEAIQEAIKNNEDINIKTEWKINRFIGFNESQRYFNLTAGTLTEHKKVTHNYNKGIIDKNGNVFPITLNEV
ncbi:MAG: DNA polymerase [Solirubrobacteraceae bacterium]|nr:DNA polymerase [Solirubrobacteraceae bacterium]